MNRASLEDNPFLVLGVPATATRLEIERAGQKLFGLLAVGSAAARTYATPFGPKSRDEAKVRTALAALRDPEARVLAELWIAALPSDEPSELPRWSEALESIGWRGPCTD
jgi:hypothetical protein